MSTAVHGDPLAVLAQKYAPVADPYTSDPVAWVEDRLGGFLWSGQRVIAQSVNDHRYTAVHSAHDLGKSRMAATLACWWLDTHPVGEAFVVSTAPTWAQVRAVLWREIGKVRNEAAASGEPLPGETTLACEWRIGEELVGYGRKPADHDQAAFQGIHARYALIILDEAGGIPKSLWDAADSLATNEDARVLAIGNPDDPSSHFERVCRPGSGWNVIHLDGLDSPNFTDEPVPDWLRPLLLSPTWVEERKNRWGEKSPLYVSKVRGRFPEVGDDVLIPPSLIRAAQQRELAGLAPGRYGVDIARFGKDDTVAVRNRGGVCRVVYTRNGLDTMAVADDLAAMLAPHKGGVPAIIDTIGLGAGVYDRLAQQKYPVIPFVASEKPQTGGAPGEPRFGNRRAEMWWAVREAFIAGEVDLDPDDDDLAAEVGSLKYRVDGRGIIWMESKEDWVKRMGGEVTSPDRADALMQSFVGDGYRRRPRLAQSDPPPTITHGIMEAEF